MEETSQLDYIKNLMERIHQETSLLNENLKENYLLKEINRISAELKKEKAGHAITQHKLSLKVNFQHKSLIKHIKTHRKTKQVASIRMRVQSLLVDYCINKNIISKEEVKQLGKTLLKSEIKKRIANKVIEEKEASEWFRKRELDA